MSQGLCFISYFHILIVLRYVDDLDSADDMVANDTPLLMCLVEQLRGGMGADERVNIGMIAICPSTGDVVWDEFEGKCLIGYSSDAAENSSATSDGHMRTELEVSSFLSLLLSANFSFIYLSQTRMVHCKTAELLLAEQGLTKPTERMLKHFAGYAPWNLPVCKGLTLNRSTTTERRIRIERHKNVMSYTDAFDFVSKFYTQKTYSGRASTSFMLGLYSSPLIRLKGAET